MIRGYIATSADGYVADREGGVGWLAPFADVDYGYDAFIAGIDTVVMGRATYEQILGFDVGWPYPGKRGLVVTSRTPPVPFDGVELWHEGPEALAARLRGEGAEAWVVGGPRLQAGFIAAGCLDRLELFVVPVLLGGGVPLFASEAGPVGLTLAASETFERGLVRLDYRLGPR